MPIIERHWEKLSEDKWNRMASSWLECVRNNDAESYECDKWWEIVVNFGLWGPPELLWEFIKLTLSLAEAESEFGCIAAGPIEYLLGRNGNDYIGKVEDECRSNPKLVAAITKCNQYRMSDEVWERIQKIRNTQR